MIDSTTFYESFDAGFRSVSASPAVTRLRGKPSKYRIATPAGDLSVWFKVNSKASALPYQPGEFWPVIDAAEILRHPRQSDEGTVSWYQYTTDEEHAAMHALQLAVCGKVAAQDEFENDVYRDMRDIRLQSVRDLVDFPFTPGHPHTALLYLDAADAFAWGAFFAAQLPAWLHRFAAAPETLAMHMWRVHWGDDASVDATARDGAAPLASPQHG